MALRVWARESVDILSGVRAAFKNAGNAFSASRGERVGGPERGMAISSNGAYVTTTVT